MKRVMQYMCLENYWPITIFGMIALVVGGRYALFLATVAYAAGLTGYASLQSACISGWEAQMRIMPLSRKWLVMGRYLQSIIPAVLLGILETAWYALGGRLDGYGFLLCGFALLIAAISLVIGFGEKGAKRTSGYFVYGIGGALLTMIPMRIGVDRNHIMPERVPLDLETGLIWLAVGVVAIAVSLPISLRLESRREW